MVERSGYHLEDIFHAPSDLTRRAMVRRLAARARSVGELAAPHRMSFAAAAKHVKVLERAGIVRRKIIGRTHLCRINPRPLSNLDRWLRYYRRLWIAQLDALGTMLDSQDRVRARKSQINRTQRR